MHYQKDIEVLENYEVVVAGAGPAGICAAVAAARRGRKTALIERYGILGGNLTAGCVGPILGSVARGTMYDELRELLGVQNIEKGGNKVQDMEETKRILLEFVLKEKVDVYLQTTIVDVICRDNKIQELVTAWKDGMWLIRGEEFIDATGDGDVAYFAGVPYDMGRSTDKKLQPVTLMYIVENVEESKAIICVGEDDEVMLGNRKFLDFTAECCQKGILPKNCYCVRLYPTTHAGERLVNTTQANYVDPFDRKQILAAEQELRRQMVIITDFLRKYVPGFENCTIKTGASTLGIRESRRFAGEYVLNINDLRSARKFEDVVVHEAKFVVDIHNPVGGGQAYGVAEHVEAYDIPWRSLVPKKINNLVLAGRCISGTHEAMASYRVMAICMAMGEAAGIGAALAAEEGVSPRELDVKQIQKELMAKGAVLFDTVRRTEAR